MLEANTVPAEYRSLKDKNLLVVSHSYNDFVKDSLETVASRFNAIHCCVRYNPIAGILSRLPIDHYKYYLMNRFIDTRNKPPNIQVHITPFLYGPTMPLYRRIGYPHFKAVDRAIANNKIEFDLIHAHFLWSSGYAGAKLKEKYGMPFVVTGHGDDAFGQPFIDEEWMERTRYVLNTADAVITVSNFNASHLRKLKVKTPIHVIPNGFPGDLFYPMDQVACRKALGLPLDKKIILGVGGLVWAKGYNYLVEAMQDVARHEKDALCIIVGSGDKKNSLENQIRSLGLEGKVILAGQKPHSQIPIWMNACDLFVLPSICEGNALVLVESLACGMPFVGTGAGGTPEIVTSEDYGLLVEWADPQGLAEKIRVGLHKDWDHARIEEYGKSFSWGSIMKETLKIYERLV